MKVWKYIVGFFTFIGGILTFFLLSSNKNKKVKENSMKANINSRFQSIVLGSIISNLRKTDKQEVMVGLLKYGKSESDWSSAHYKAQ